MSRSKSIGGNLKRGRLLVGSITSSFLSDFSIGLAIVMSPFTVAGLRSLLSDEGFLASMAPSVPWTSVSAIGCKSSFSGSFGSMSATGCSSILN